MSERINNLYEGLLQKDLEHSTDLKWLNLGYWKTATTTLEASEAMAEIVAKTADLKNSKNLLDVGFGYGEQLVFWAKNYPQINITGVNLVAKQVQIAQEKLDENHLNNRVTLLCNDAVVMSFTNNSFDRIIAIECAFHFNTRQKFLENAFAALEKGGIICLAEGLPNEQNLNKEIFKERSEFLGIPLPNQYSVEKYKEKLLQIGFKSIEIIDISEYVIPFSAFVLKQKKGWRNTKRLELPENKKELNEMIQFFKEVTTIDKYYIIKAKKE